MDSLTQIVLGAAVGEVVLGRKIGNKAILYGAIAGTIPDLDVFASYFTNEVNTLAIHRGFTHSILFAVLFAPIFGWLVSRYEKHKNFKDWSWLFFWGLLTHPILDGFTTWGTQLFWPFNLKVALKTIFVVDPLYTLPFLTCVIITMCYKHNNKKRRYFNYAGIALSSFYLIVTVVLKSVAVLHFKEALDNQHMSYSAIDVRPSPLNTILWNANVDTKDAYLLANYSFFDSQAIAFEVYPKNHDLLGDLKFNDKVQQMISITEGWYTIIEKNDGLYFNDLRFGLLGLEPNSQNFVFQYKIEETNNNVNFIETDKNQRNTKKLLNDLLIRIMGN